MKFDIYVTFPIRFQSTFSVRNYLFFQYVCFIFLPHLTSIVLFLINYSPQYVFWSYFFILHQFTISIIQSVLFFKIEIWKLNLNSECVRVCRCTQSHVCRDHFVRADSKNVSKFCAFFVHNICLMDPKFAWFKKIVLHLFASKFFEIFKNIFIRSRPCWNFKG